MESHAGSQSIQGRRQLNHAMPWGSAFGGAVSPSKPTAGHNESNLTREAFVHAVRAAVLATAPLDDLQRARLSAAKLVYGAGDGGYRGICYYGAWENGEQGHAFVEIAATGEENAVQLAGTTVHELGHVIAGPSGGHKAEWRTACDLLGLTDAQAVGHVYTMEGFKPALRAAIEALGEPNDGKPAFGSITGPLAPRTTKIKPCPMGRGTRGGKSRGTGSGSRLRLWECACAKPVKVRVASDDFKARCDECGQPFAYKGK